MNANCGFAYLFERFPSFTQTFCAREVGEWQKLGYHFPVFSLRSVSGEEVRNFPPALYEQTTLVPDVEAMAKRWWTPFSLRARRDKHALYDCWGKEAGGRRALEAAWVAPLLKSQGIHHVHVHFAGRAARTAYWLWKRYGISYSFTAHANDVFVDTPGLFLDEIFREAKFVVTVSDFSAAALKQRFPGAAEKIHRVYNGIDTQAFALPPAPASPPLLLSVGRYIEKKGFPDLIQACAELRDLNFRCELTGEGAMAGELAKQIHDLQLTEKVHITGPKSETEIRTRLSQAALFVLACCKEKDGGMDNLPTVIMEAMAAGLPVVSTNLAGVPEMVEHERSGLLVEPNAPASLAKAIRTLLESPETSASMATAARELVRERFDLSVTSKHLQSLFGKYNVLDR